MALVRRARHREAFVRARELFRAYKDEPMARFWYAAMLGDHVDGLAEREVERNRKSSVRLLKPLLRRLRAFDLPTRFRIRNEYYWFSRQHYKQYLLGVEAERRGYPKALYPQGVGAAWHAFHLARTGDSTRAARWAGKSVSVWRSYLRSSRYYNAYVHLGLAYGVLGRLNRMEKALRDGARLAGRAVAYHEFSDIRKKVEELSRRRSLIRAGRIREVALQDG